MNKILNITAVLAAALSVSACKTTVQKPVKVDYQMEYTVGDVPFDMVKIPAGHYTMGFPRTTAGRSRAEFPTRSPLTVSS